MLACKDTRDAGLQGYRALTGCRTARGSQFTAMSEAEPELSTTHRDRASMTAGTAQKEDSESRLNLTVLQPVKRCGSASKALLSRLLSRLARLRCCWLPWHSCLRRLQVRAQLPADLAATSLGSSTDVHTSGTASMRASSSAERFCCCCCCCCCCGMVGS
jgi:hypothetical protein